jgi:nucleotide-binding universal stress UspA family protein
MVRIANILCPIDFSEFSRHAFDRAVGVARCYGAKVSVLHVLPVPSAVPAVPYGPEGPGPFGFHAPDRDLVVSELRRFLATDRDIGVPLHYEVIEGPSAAKEIMLQTERLDADFVVLGTHGRSGFDRLLLGSVTEKVLRKSPVPVLTIPPRLGDVTPSGRDPFRRILYATDFSAGSNAALTYAASLARHANGHLTIVHVVEPLPVGADSTTGTSFDVAGYEAALERDSAARLRKIVPDEIRVTCNAEDVITKGRPYREILRIAGERLSDLIVLGVHGRNALDRLVFGSTAEHVVRRAVCPVLTVRTPDRPR